MSCLPSRFRRLATEGGWIIVGQIVSILGALVLVRVLTEFLTPKQYGQLALGLTLAGLVNQLIMGGISTAIGRFYSISNEQNDVYGYLCASRQLMRYATLVVVVIGLMFTLGLTWLGYTQWIGLTTVTLFFAVISAYNTSLGGIQNAARQRAVVAFHSSLDAWLKILLVLGVLFWLGSSGTAVVLGYIFSLMVVTGSQLFFLRRLIANHGAHASDNSWIRQLWSYSWPFSTWGLFTWLQQCSDRWALEAFATTHEVGLYTVLFQLGYIPISMATAMVMSFLGPILYQRSGDAKDLGRNATVHQLTWRLTLASLMLTLIGFVFALILHRWIFSLLVASQYQSVSYLLPWVVLAGGLFAAGQMLALKLMSDMKPAAMTMGKIVTALLGVMLNYCLSLMFGLRGVVGALVVFSLIYLLWMSVLSFRIPSRNHYSKDAL